MAEDDIYMIDGEYEEPSTFDILPTDDSVEELDEPEDPDSFEYDENGDIPDPEDAPPDNPDDEPIEESDDAGEVDIVGDEDLVDDYDILPTDDSIEEVEEIDETAEDEGEDDDAAADILNDNVGTLPCTCSVKEGDTVQIMVVNGEPTVIGVVGWGDGLENDISLNAALAAEAKKDAEDANTAANNAQTKADQADAAAKEASTAATNAETKAKEAADAAANALTKANDAANEAAEATQKATDAQNKADLVETNMAGVAAEVVDIKADAEAMRQEMVTSGDLDVVKTEMSATYATKDAVTTLGQQTSQSIAEVQNTMTQNYAKKSEVNGAIVDAKADLQTQISQNASDISSVAKSVESVEVDLTENATKIQEAIGAAEAAQSTANQAKTDASQAAGAAATAQEAANQAATAASNAQSAADIAKTNAATAQKAADDAAAELATAQSKLAEVEGNANATAEDLVLAQEAVAKAQKAADDAAQDAIDAANAATNAQATADKAKTDAANAQTTANEAKESAVRAKEAADAAQDAADAAQDDVNALSTRVTTAETKITQNSEAITSVASRTTSVENKFNNYSTTEQMQSAIQQMAGEITSTVTATYATKDEAAALAESAQADVTNLAISNSSNMYCKISDFHTFGWSHLVEFMLYSRAGESIKVNISSNDNSYTASAVRMTNAYSKINAIYYVVSENAIYVQLIAWANNLGIRVLSNSNGSGNGTITTNVSLPSDAVKIPIVENADSSDVTELSTRITQNAEAIELCATKTEVATSLEGYYTKTESDAEFKVVNDSINSKVSSSEFSTYKTTVTNDISSAKNAAISTAASDATTKANDAKSAAISTAASDATTKANAAKEAAVSEAAADATEKADAAEAAAISTAAADATAKANAAKSDAVSTAATDATTKANAAKSDAIATAAADATSKADAAEEAANDYTDGKVAAVTSEVNTVKSTVAQHTTDLSGITSRVETTEESITTINGSVTSLNTRMSAAEQKITDEAIISTVSSTYATKSALSATDTKAANAATAASNAQKAADDAQDDVDALASNVSTNYATKSEVTQTANSITSSVSATYATKTELSKKAGDYTVELYNGTGGNPKPVKFVTVNYSTCDSNNGVSIKIGMLSGHGNGTSYVFLQDASINVNYNGGVSVDNVKSYGAETPTYDGAVRQYGDIFWVIDTTNKIVDFYTLMGQYARMYQTPWKRTTWSTGGTVTQYTSCTVYSSGTKVWANNSDIALMSDVTELSTRITQTESSITSQASSISSLGTRMSTVEQTASGLSTRVSTTEGKVSTLEQTASGLTLRLDEAEDDISTAQSTADTAKTNAATAQSTANTAKTNAATAQSTADTAKTNAATAQTTANNAATAASNAQSTANTARTEASNAAKTATNYLNFSDSGLVVGNHTASTLGNNVLINSDSVDIRSGSTVLSSFGASTIELGRYSSDTKIEFCNNEAALGVETVEGWNGDVTTASLSSENVMLNGSKSSSLYSYCIKGLTASGEEVSKSDTNAYYMDTRKAGVDVETDPDVVGREAVQVRLWARELVKALSTETSLQSSHSSELDLTTKELYCLADNINLVSRYGTTLDSVDGAVNSLVPVRVPNNVSFASYNSSGNARSLAFINANDQYFYGYASYNTNEGSTYFDGNSVYIRSKGSIHITAPNQGLSSRVLFQNKALWTGSYNMSDTQSITLSEAVTAQPNGIILAFSYYDANGTVQNYNWNYFFVPKYHVAQNPGTGCNFMIANNKFGVVTNKYLYINDTTITGAAGNVATGTASGITYANNRYVLRRVIGV